MSESIEAVLAAHIARDRYDEDGHSLGTYCTCGGWEGDYFAEGEAGPFDDHLAAAIRAHLAATLTDPRTVEAIARARFTSYDTGSDGARLQMRAIVAETLAAAVGVL